MATTCWTATSATCLRCSGPPALRHQRGSLYSLPGLFAQPWLRVFRWLKAITCRTGWLRAKIQRRSHLGSQLHPFQMHDGPRSLFSRQNRGGARAGLFQATRHL